MHFDWSINLGALVNGVLFIGTILSVYLSMLRRLDKLEAKMDTIWQWFIRDAKDRSDGR